METVPALAGLSDTTFAAVNGPPVAPSVSSIVAATPATMVTVREDMMTGATVVVMTGAESMLAGGLICRVNAWTLSCQWPMPLRSRTGMFRLDGWCR